MLRIPDLPDADVLAAVKLGPDAEHILAAAHAQNSASHLLARFPELIAYDGEQKIFPISIRNTLLESDDEFAPFFVFFVLPDGPNALLEYMVVGYGR